MNMDSDLRLLTDFTFQIKINIKYQYQNTLMLSKDQRNCFELRSRNAYCTQDHKKTTLKSNKIIMLTQGQRMLNELKIKECLLYSSSKNAYCTQE
jgi:hypothetical protein